MATKGVFGRYESGVQSYARAFPRVFKRARGAQNRPKDHGAHQCNLLHQWFSWCINRCACGNRYHRDAAGLPLQGTTTMPFDGYFGTYVNTIDYIDRMLSDPSSGIGAPAAVIVETIQGEKRHVC